MTKVVDLRQYVGKENVVYEGDGARLQPIVVTLMGKLEEILEDVPVSPAELLLIGLNFGLNLVSHVAADAEQEREAVFAIALASFSEMLEASLIHMQSEEGGAA